MSDMKKEMAFGDRAGAGRGAGGGRDRGPRDDRGGGDLERGGARGFGRRKVCRYCADKNLKVDYKNAADLKYFVTERGKIVPRRISVLLALCLRSSAPTPSPTIASKSRTSLCARCVKAKPAATKSMAI